MSCGPDLAEDLPRAAAHLLRREFVQHLGLVMVTAAVGMNAGKTV